MKITIEPVGYIESSIKNQEEAPPQGMLEEMPVQGCIVVFPQFAEGIEGVVPGMKLDVIWQFHKCEETWLKVIPRRRTELRGVFSTRSPKRPNHMGLTTVTVLEVNENRIAFEGCDMLDGSPVLDIKPTILPRKGEEPLT